MKALAERPLALTSTNQKEKSEIKKNLITSGVPQATNQMPNSEISTFPAPVTCLAGQANLPM